jgi:hypothetical protein
VARTAGTKLKPLPSSLTVGLRALGFREMAEARPNLPPVWRHPLQSHLFVEAVTANLPGSDAVIARWRQDGVIMQGRIEIDTLLAELGAQVERAKAGAR